MPYNNYKHARLHENTGLQQATSQDEHLQHLKEHIMKSWPENKDQIPQDMNTC